jgi:hypothetical protein
MTIKVILGIITYVIVSFLIGGCETLPTPGSSAAMIQKIEQRRETDGEMVQDTINNLPPWFTELPRENYEIYAVGSATSLDLQLAMDKATLNAKRRLADRLKGLLSSRVKEYLAETGKKISSLPITDTERVTKNILKNVNVAGYSVEKVAFRPHKTFFRSFVLLRYPMGEANDVLTMQRDDKAAMSAYKKAEVAYEELDNEPENEE